MKILILGTGAMGAFYGWTLASAGHDVWHWVRPEKFAAEKGRRLQIKAMDRRARAFKKGPRTYAFSFLETEDQIQTFDWILLPLPYFQMEAAVQSLAALAHPGALFLLMGNLWHPVDRFDAWLPGRYVFVFPHHGGSITQEQLNGWLTPAMSLGEPDGSETDRIRQLKAFFESAGYRPQIRDMRGWLLVHFAAFTGFYAEALRMGGVARMARSWKSLIHSQVIAREAMEVVQRLGVDASQFPEGRKAYQPLWQNALLYKLLALMPGVARTMDQNRKTADWESYGHSVLETAKAIGVDTPVLEETVMAP